MSLKTRTPVAFLCCPWNYVRLGWRYKYILPPGLGHIGWSTLPTAWGDYPRKLSALSHVLQLGQNGSYALKDYWLTLEQFFMPLYGHTMKWDKLYHILIFIHFSDSSSEPDKADENETGFGKREQYLISTLIHVLNVTAQLKLMKLLFLSKVWAASNSIYSVVHEMILNWKCK